MMIKKPLWYIILIVILGTLYLIPEAIFNVNLVNLSGVGTPTEEDLESLELFGRTISGIGVFLLLADFLSPRLLRNKFIGIFSFLMLFIIVWPIVFYGQKYLVEKYIIESSTAKERQDALITTTLKDALVNNVISINGVSYNTEDMNNPENLTFVSLFGGLIYIDNSLSEKIDSQKKDIIKMLLEKKVYSNFDKYYEDYSKMYDSLSMDYKSYANGSKKYNSAIEGVAKKEQELWTDIENETSKGFEDYNRLKSLHRKKASDLGQEYSVKIVKMFDAENDCLKRYESSKKQERRENCLNKVHIKYKAMIEKAGLGFIERDYWLIEEKISKSENTQKTIVAGLLTGGLYTGLQALDLMMGGDAGLKDKRYTYTNNPDYYTKKFLEHPNFIKIFEKDTGYSFHIEKIEDFRKDQKTQNNLISGLKSKGIILNNNWNISKRKEFSNAVESSIKEKAKNEWYAEARKNGFNKLEPNMEWNKFQLHKEIQNKIKNKMKDKYVDNMKTDWNKANFKKFVMEPNLEKEADKYYKILTANEIEFENNGKYAEDGKQSLRSIIVPPISMFLSLFLLCLTIAKLPSKYMSIINYNKEVNKTSKIKNIGQKLIMPSLILIIPLLLVKNTYTEQDNSTVNYFLNKIEMNANPIFSYSLKWTLHTQPLIYPLGTKLEEMTGLYEKFNVISHEFKEIDINYKKLFKEENIKTTLLIKSNVKIEKIIFNDTSLNYRDNMEIEEGLYDIELLYKNKKKIKRKIKVEQGKNIISL